jgi:ornithine carbamoyltransferase
MPSVIAKARPITHNQHRLGITDLIADWDLARADVDLILALARHVKSSPHSYARALEGKQLAMIFERPSLRTRVTFEVGMTSLGGHVVYFDHDRPRLGDREPIKDIARNLERWVDGIVARLLAHASVVELAENASIPVINGLTDLFHPCQALGDFFTLREKFGMLDSLRLAYVGDGNKVCHSLMITGAKLGVSVSVATPPGFEPQPAMIEAAQAAAHESGASLRILHDPMEAVAGAHAVYTDLWVSTGQEYSAHLRSQIFEPYRITEDLMAAACPEAVFMHCLPAHRGEEVAHAVIDSPRSIVYDQAENRLHVQKALLLLLLGTQQPESRRQ